MREPLNLSEAKRRILALVESGGYSFSDHAEGRKATRALDTSDVINVLRHGDVARAEFQKGSWRYVFETGRMRVVVAFRSEREFRVVTAIRTDQR